MSDRTENEKLQRLQRMQQEMMSRYTDAELHAEVQRRAIRGTQRIRQGLVDLDRLRIRRFQESRGIFLTT